MKKVILTISMLTIALATKAQFPSPYCGPLTFSSGIEPITLVNFAGINNTTAAVSTIAHENFISQTANVTAGQTYPISLKGNTVGAFITGITVFIDWNEDADFEDQNEEFYIGEIINSTGTDTTTLRGNITIPRYVSGGTKRMRVVKTWTDANPSLFPNPCNNSLSDFGQAEDYSIAVTAIPQCISGSNFPLNTIGNLMCDGSNIIVSTQMSTANYFEVIVVKDKDYRIRSSNNTDYLTIANKTAAKTYFAGSSSLVWKAEVSDTIRVYVHADVACAIDTFKRTLNIACGTECLNGALFPSQTFTSTLCDNSTLNIISNLAHTGEYANVQVNKGNTYTFSTGVNTDFITLSLDGEYVTYKGNSPLIWRADTTGIVRFYANVDENCNVDTLLRTKSVICEALEIPGCVTNMYPPDGDTLYLTVAQYDFGYDLPTTGGEIASMTFNVGLDTLSAFYIVEIPTVNVIQITVDATDLNKTYYWWVIAKNDAGVATCNPTKQKFIVLASPPVGIDNSLANNFSAFPNPIIDMLTILNFDEIDNIEIINLIGQSTAYQNINDVKFTVDMSAFIPGVYQLKLTTKNKVVKYLKVLKK